MAPKTPPTPGATSPGSLPARLWSVDDLAEYLDVPTSYVYRLNRENRIRRIHVGKKVRYHPDDIADYLERESIGPGRTRP